MITPKGYKIPINHPRLNEFKKELVVCPFIENAVRYPIYRISDKYIYLPKYYGIKKLGLPDIIKEQEGLPVKFKFVGKLRDYQIPVCKKILTHLNEHGSGLASLYTGWGKTCAAIWIASKLNVKTLIVVHTENLLNQWKERIEQFLGEECGLIQGKNTITDKNIVIGMIQSISMKEYNPETFKDFGLCLFDECFPAQTIIHTNKGKISIYQLFNIFQDQGLQNDIEILSYNQFNRVFEYKPLTFAWEKNNNNLIKLFLYKKEIVCTLNHKILTLKGYIEADKLLIGDIVMCKYSKEHKNCSIICPALNNDQLQIIYGSYLGNGDINKTNKGRLRLKMVHSKEQKEYCKWKANMLGISKIKYKQNILGTFEFETNCFDIENNFIFKSETVSDWLIDKIDARGIAIWFMDSGTSHKDKLKNGLDSCYSIIHSTNFNYESHVKFVELFKKYKIKCDIKINKTYYYLYFNENNEINLFNLIQNYIYYSDKYPWNNTFLEYGTLKITNKEYTNNESGKVYDIEVKDNHNFIITDNCEKSISGPIVSNCHHLPGKVFSRVFYKIGTKYNLGLSATITRPDGLTKVIKYFIGEPIVNLKLNTIIPKVIIKYTSIEPIREKTMINGKINIPGMINELCNSFMRTLEVVNEIKKKYSEGRKILVLTDRRNHCMELKRLLSDYDCGLYMGGMKNEALQESNKKRIIIATFHIASEGYDNPELDTLVFASPKSKIEQACGRILRQENENDPEIIDFVDPFSVFNNFYFSRLKFYKSKKYTFEKKEINKQNEHKQEIKLEKYSIIEE